MCTLWSDASELLSTVYSIYLTVLLSESKWVLEHTVCTLLYMMLNLVKTKRNVGKSVHFDQTDRGVTLSVLEENQIEIMSLKIKEYLTRFGKTLNVGDLSILYLTSKHTFIALT